MNLTKKYSRFYQICLLLGGVVHQFCSSFVGFVGLWWGNGGQFLDYIGKNGDIWVYYSRFWKNAQFNDEQPPFEEEIFFKLHNSLKS